MSHTFKIMCVLHIIVAVTFSGKVYSQTVIADEVPTTFNVSPNGAFTYQLPLRLPPGIGQMVPQLSINYNSQSAGGSLGVGWSLSGLSSISRSQPTIYQHNDLHQTTFQNNDIYSLDGQPLFVSDSPGYLTWIKNFSKIQRAGVAGNGPSYWIAETPEGVVYEYGNSSSSKMIAEGRSEVLMWSINKIYDKNGNYITFEYYNNIARGEYRVSKISYSGNSALPLTPPTEIFFNYVGRADQNKAWVNGSLLQDSALIQSIDIKQNGVSVNKYEFTYAVNMYSHLTSIKEKRPTSIDLPTITINWGTTGVDLDIKDITNANTGNSTFVIGDFNGDGMSDFTSTPTTLPSGGYAFDLFSNTKNDDFLKSSPTLGPVTGTATTNVSGHNGKIMFDYNGDGFDDLILVNYSSNPSYAEVSLTYYESNGTSFNGVQTIFNYKNYDGITRSNYVGLVKFVMGDFDGDGKKNVLAIVPNALNNVGGTWVGRTFDTYIIGHEYFGTLTASGPAGWLDGAFKYTGGISTTISKATVLDFNGDHKDDLMVTTEQLPFSCWVFDVATVYHQTSGANSARPSPFGGNLTPIFWGTYPSNYHKEIKVGDFNGDGKSDILTWRETVSNPCTGLWEIAYSTGANGVNKPGFVFGPTSIPAPLSTTLNSGEPCYQWRNSIHVADFNGDGKDDILKIYDPNYPSQNMMFELFYAKGYHSFDHQHGDLPNFYRAEEGWYSIGDFNGDGQSDLLWHAGGYSGYTPKLVYFRKNDNRHVVASIVSAGKTITITSKPLTYLTDYLPLPYNVLSTYPYYSKQTALKVVTDLKDNIAFNNTYKYEKLIIHSLGFGLMGFDKIIVTDVSDNKVSENFYHVMDDITSPLPYLAKSLLWDKTTFTSIQNGTLPAYPTTKPISITEHLYSNANGGAGGSSRIITKSYESTIDYSKGTSSSKAFTISSGAPGTVYYEFGEPTSTTEINGPVTITTSFTYDMTGAFHNRSKATSITTNTVRASKPAYVRRTDYSYDAKGQISIITHNPGTSNQWTSTMYYNTLGNPLAEEINGLGVSGTRSTNNIFSSDGRFKIEEKNPLGYRNKYTYNVWGSVLTHTGVDDQVTTYEYDAANRLTKVISPTGVTSQSTYSLAASATDKPLFQTAQFVVTTTTTGISGSKQIFYDYYKRKLREVRPSFTGQSIYADTKYKLNGLVEYTTNEYLSTNAASAIKTTFTYDNSNRETLRTITGGAASVSTTYTPITGGMEVSVKNVSSLETKKVYTDESGTTYKTEHQGNIVEYDINSNGQHDAQLINGDLALQSTYSYDNLGNLVDKTEPNSGTTYYTYNSLGELTSEESANGHVITYTYDKLSRLIDKTEPSLPPASPATLHYYYTYGNTNGTGSTGKLVQTVSPYGTTITNAYDAFGRLIQTTEAITSPTPAQSFVTKFTYDDYFRQVSHQYPSGDIISNGYNSYGYLERKKLGKVGSTITTDIWSVQSKNALNQTTESWLYNSSGAPLYTHIKDYNTLGYNTKQRFRPISLPSLIERDYTFNLLTGNLSSRKDVIRNITESFTYDNLNRLKTTSNTAGAPTMQLNYDVVGNILKKTDVSTSSRDWKYNAYALIRMPEPQTSSPAYVVPKAKQTETYNVAQKIKTIEENNERYEFTYWSDQERAKMTISSIPSGTLLKTKYYGTNYEKIVDATTGVIEQLDYVFAEDELIAVIYNKTGSSTTTFYTLSDYLGSITHVFDNLGGGVANGLIEERNYDAWGRLRNPSNLQYLSTTPTWKFDRGYTGHEHLLKVNIINMNGRLYDPLVGRMLSTDPYVSDNTNSQSFNKYAYCNNNPLKFVDPTGNVVDIAVIVAVALFSGAANVASHYGTKEITVGQGLGYFAVGAISSFAGGYLGGLASGIGGAAISGFTNSVIGSAGNAWIAGESFEQGLSQGIGRGILSAGTASITYGAMYGLGYGLNRGFREVEKIGYKKRYFKELDRIGIKFAGQPVKEADVQSYFEKNFAKRLASIEHKPTYGGIDNVMAPKSGVSVFNGSDVTKAGSATIYLNSRTLVTDGNLYFALDHELYHCELYSDGTAAAMWIAYGEVGQDFINEMFAYSHSYMTAQQMNVADHARTGLMKFAQDHYEKESDKFNIFLKE